jgi:hypothetical protein
MYHRAALCATPDDLKLYPILQDWPFVLWNASSSTQNLHRLHRTGLKISNRSFPSLWLVWQVSWIVQVHSLPCQPTRINERVVLFCFVYFFTAKFPKDVNRTIRQLLFREAICPAIANPRVCTLSMLSVNVMNWLNPVWQCLHTVVVWKRLIPALEFPSSPASVAYFINHGCKQSPLHFRIVSGEAWTCSILYQMQLFARDSLFPPSVHHLTEFNPFIATHSHILTAWTQSILNPISAKSSIAEISQANEIGLEGNFIVHMMI